MNGKYLITTEGWFYAPDGQQYKAAWGNVEILEDSLIGVKTNRNSTNWYAKVGSNDKEIIIAGCQIHYAIKCNNIPNTESTISENDFEGKMISSDVRTRIYIAE
jgi:hypothetical protein